MPREGHLLVLGWNDKGPRAIQNFRADPRFADREIVVVADLEESPLGDVSFVAGPPSKAYVLAQADARAASAAVILANMPDDPRADHESAIVTASLRRLNADVVIGVEMVDDDNREHLMFAGANALVDDTDTIANLLVRSIQDIGVSDLVWELLANETGSEIYRIDIDERFVDKTWKEYASALVDRHQCGLGIERDDVNIINPEPDLVLRAGDEAYVIAAEAPEARAAQRSKPSKPSSTAEAE